MPNGAKSILKAYQKPQKHIQSWSNLKKNFTTEQFSSQSLNSLYLTYLMKYTVVILFLLK